MTLAISSEAMPLPDVHDLVDTRMAQKLSQTPGIGMVSLAGGQRPAVRIQIDPAALAARGLAMEDVRAAIDAASANQRKGSFNSPTRSIMMDANDQRNIARWSSAGPTGRR
ncbi:AcrB/AcrD/AcrF family protein [Sphingobium faniae]|nr:AcrB/AcrD/AcrF family protein [Sphingobium faniae]